MVEGVCSIVIIIIIIISFLGGWKISHHSLSVALKIKVETHLKQLVKKRNHSCITIFFPQEKKWTKKHMGLLVFGGGGSGNSDNAGFWSF